MFELIVVGYLMSHFIYYLLAKKSLPKGGHKDDVFLILGIPIHSIMPEKVTEKLLSDEERFKLSKIHSQKVLERESYSYACGKIGVVYLILALGGMFGIILGNNYRPAAAATTVIERPEFGEASEIYNLSYTIESNEGIKEGLMPLVIEPKLPLGDEAIKLLESKYEPLLLYMLSEEGKQNHLTSDLHFEAEPFEEAIKVKYVSLEPEFLSDIGELRRNMMALETKYPISVLATLEISNLQMSFVYNFDAYRAPLNLSEESNLVIERVQIEPNQIILPETLAENDGHVDWLTTMEGVRGIQVFAASVLIAMILYVLKKRDLDQAIEDRQALILGDFPDVVSKLTLLINAGMTFNRAWHKIVIDYQERSGRTRPLYEEMVMTTTQLQNGMPEREALEEFGKRTGSKEVIRMTAILIQNLRRGSSALSASLKQLSHEAWEIRTSNAKMLGEKASTKLLLPMGISFITVIIIVLAPTLMSMNI